MLIAGLDVGNSTTEVVLARQGADGPRPVTTAQARTTGRKGSEESLRGARRLLEKAETDAGARCELVVLCDLHPVDTFTLPMQLEADPNAAVRDLGGAGSHTPAGEGLASGVQLPLDRLNGQAPDGRRVIVSVPAGVDFEQAAARINRALAAGWQIAGVLLEGDDAVLVHHRLAKDIPIVDEVDLTGVRAGATVALEVAAPGEGVASLCDPAAIAHHLGLAPAQLSAVARGARELLGRRAAAVVRADDCPPRLNAPERPAARLEVEIDGAAHWIHFDARLVNELERLPPGVARSVEVDWKGVPRRCIAIRDAWVADLRALDDAAWLRRGVARLHCAPLAVLRDLACPPKERLARSLGRPVCLAGAEAQSAALGARTTPGAPESALVLDIGGGTIDLASEQAVVSAAGAGELMTSAVAAALGMPRGLAERVKRGPALWIASPHLAQHEDGSRRFLSPPAPGSSVGRLALDDATLTPFAANVAPEEWRALRHALKEQVIGANAQRCLNMLRESSGTLLIAGGGALDRELVAMIGERLRPDGWVVARADVAGRFGPRFAVAWGALLTAPPEAERVAA